MARIVQVTEAFGGGVFTSVTQICNALAASGHEVHLLHSLRPETPAAFERLIDPRVRLREVCLTREIRPLADWRGLRTLIRAFREIQPDIIHLHSSKAGFLGRLVARWLGWQGRTFYSPRGLPFLQRDASPGRRALYRWLERLATAFGGRLVACSAGERAEIVARLKVGSPHLIENAVDVARIPPRPPRADGPVRIGLAGRITPARNPDLFARLAQVVGNDGIEWHWIGGGDPEAQARLERAGVQVSGWLPREEALVALSGLDVYLQTSSLEGMPLAVIEAQVMGLPAVVTDVVGNRDVVADGKTGFVCASEPSLAESLGRLVHDAALREVLGRQAREGALSRFSLGRMTRELLALYGLEK